MAVAAIFMGSVAGMLAALVALVLGTGLATAATAYLLGGAGVAAVMMARAALRRPARASLRELPGETGRVVG